MHVYFSGIGGAGLGPLALLAKDCGYDVSGSDLTKGSFTAKLADVDIEVSVGEQNGDYIQQLHSENPIDWFVYTAALPEDHAELEYAKNNGIRVSKRDEFINQIISDKNLRLIAVSGTHGKTTTTAMLIWLFCKIGKPISYQVGTNLPWGPSAKYDPRSDFFVYEADEYDRNMLKFKPEIAVLPSIDYDHPDTYPTVEDYQTAFQQFVAQSQSTILAQSVDESKLEQITLPGEHMRHNALLAIEAVLQAYPETDKSMLITAINKFPGTERRFEKLAENLYTDYAHHPTELKAVVQMALEISDDVVVIYQPHQNKRQTLVADQYADVFEGVSKVYWLPTYNPSGRDSEDALSPEQLIAKLNNPEIALPAEMNDELQTSIQQHLKNSSLVLACSAGTLDAWLRKF